MRSAIAARPLTRSDRAKICSWVRHVKKRVRAARRGKPDDYLVRGDDDLSEVIVDYSSIAYYGWTWPGEERLAEILNESDRNIRKRLARLRTAELLIVISPRDRWRSNRYIPVLDGRPLFEVALTSEQVRDAIAALHRDDCDTGTPVPPHDTQRAERQFHPKRSTWSMHGGTHIPPNLQGITFKKEIPLPVAQPRKPEQRDHCGRGKRLLRICTRGPRRLPSLRQRPVARATAPSNLPSPTAVLAATSWKSERSPLGPSRRRRLLSSSASPALCATTHTRKAAAVSNAQRTIRMPAVSGASQRPSKSMMRCARPHARRANDGLVTGSTALARRGIFATPKQAPSLRACGSRKVPRNGPRGWLHGRCLPRRSTASGELQTGWMFESEWPPNFNFVQRDGGAA